MPLLWGSIYQPVFRFRRMALDVLEESRTNLMGCSKCGAARLTRHKIIDPHSFVCGHAECLYAERKCKTPPDDPKEW